MRTDYKLGAIVRQDKYGHAHNEAHSQVAVQECATPKNILETKSIAVLMAGGPAFAHVPEILKVFDVLGMKY